MLATSSKVYIIMVYAKYSVNTVKPVNIGHPTERPCIVFIEKWSLF